MTRARESCLLLAPRSGLEIEHDNKAAGKPEAVSGVCESSSRSARGVLQRALGKEASEARGGMESPSDHVSVKRELVLNSLSGVTDQEV